MIKSRIQNPEEKKNKNGFRLIILTSDFWLLFSVHRKGMLARLKGAMRVQGRGIILGCAIIFSFLLVASCGNKRAAQTRLSPATALPVARTLPPLPTRPLSPKLEELRKRSMQTAADLRELPFTSDVAMSELSGWEYGTRASEMAHILGGDDLRSLGKLAAAGGVLPEGTDLESLAASFTALSAGATYSPLDKQVLIVDRFKDDSLITHEFTHALQDQHFDLMKLLIVRPYNFDRTEAVFAIIEGDAMNVQRRLEQGESYARRTLEEITRQETERFSGYRKEVGEFFPPLLTETFIFRYRDGARFVEAVRRTRGERGVDELFQRPPVSSEQILHLEKYQQNEAPREVQLDENGFAVAGWKSVTSTPLGEIGVRGLLMAGISDKDATRAASGWGGDRAYLFEKAGSTPLFVWKTVWDKPMDAEEFFDAYNALRHRNSMANSGPMLAGDTAQMTWREGGRITIARRAGDTVIVIRGAEADVNAALELAQR
ncbi:MAG TPA: hypothetical protein VGN95_05785 [Pyrinomonadaceae bacterium]|nr:hypothetical protein [Pyrinomonadaceae bacterium]